MDGKVREHKWMYRRPAFGVLTLLISISMAVAAYAGQFADADAAYARGDYATTYRLLKPLAEGGNAKAQYNLGFMYDQGLGVPKDYVLTHMWFSLAASRFHASEGEKRELAVKSRNLVASKMTPAQIAEAQRLAREWKPKKEVK